MAENRVIGKDNAMPFNVKGNLARFKEITTGHPCVMGRKTWESLPKKPLPGRLNIIISKTMKLKESAQSSGDTDNIKIFESIPDALEFCKDHKKIFICGGESIYRQTLAFADKIDLTVVAGQCEGDAFFPEIGDNWKKADTVSYNDFIVVNYVRINQEQK